MRPAAMGLVAETVTKQAAAVDTECSMRRGTQLRGSEQAEERLRAEVDAARGRAASMEDGLRAAQADLRHATQARA